MEYRIAHPTIHGAKRWEIRVRDGETVRKIIVDAETNAHFATRADAQRYVERIRVQSGQGFGAKVRDLGAFMFSPGSAWAQRQAKRRDGRDLSPHTVAEHELNWRLHIEPELGDTAIRDVDTQAIDRFLYSLEVSSRTRRNIAGTLRAILAEGVYHRVVKSVPPIELPRKQKGRKPSVLTLPELRLLFPTARRTLLKLWGGEISHPEAPGDALALAACSAVMFFGGLRPQEARAAHTDQVISKGSVFLVTKSMDSQGKALEYAKMGDARDPRYRGTFLVDRAMKILELWMKERPRHDFLFTYQGRAIRGELLHARLQAAAGRAGILTPGRRLIPYSGRMTFNTVMRPLLPQDVLMLLMGHHDMTMTDHYDVPSIVDRMQQMTQYRAKMNKSVGA